MGHLGFERPRLGCSGNRLIGRARRIRSAAILRVHVVFDTTHGERHLKVPASRRYGAGVTSKVDSPMELQDQMYSSAIAPSLHRATVTMRPPPSNSPTTHVHSPDPNLIGCDVIWGGVPPADST